MSDKVQLIKQEIESYKESMKSLRPHSDFRRGQITAYNHILQFIDSIPEESISEDLTHAAWHYANNLHMKRQIQLFEEKDVAADFIAGAEWQRQQDQETIELAEDHAMLAGMNKMKEEILSKAVSEVTLIDWYISSIDETIPPIWTEAHINELYRDFYLIPKEVLQ